MVARRSTSRHDWRRWWWRLLPLACCFVCWVASTAVTVAAAAGVAVTSLPGFDGPLPFSLETGTAASSPRSPSQTVESDVAAAVAAVTWSGDGDGEQAASEGRPGGGSSSRRRRPDQAAAT
ncbi:hypothetical protein OsI_36017 [Oryza sativa Indica Group]|uniref:Uncharacterized protein n=1 Tax=Oryza sativa subsp. indica TaxID=39946 RepID=B8BKC8_ORYSI|nr:hypothetical protein OsI_36017 [Oryza sativa Indica Group]